MHVCCTFQVRVRWRASRGFFQRADQQQETLTKNQGLATSCPVLTVTVYVHKKMQNNTNTVRHNRAGDAMDASLMRVEACLLGVAACWWVFIEVPYCHSEQHGVSHRHGDEHPYGLVYVVWEGRKEGGISWSEGRKRRLSRGWIKGDWRWMWTMGGSGKLRSSLGVPILQESRRDDAAEDTWGVQQAQHDNTRIPEVVTERARVEG